MFPNKPVRQLLCAACQEPLDESKSHLGRKSHITGLVFARYHARVQCMRALYSHIEECLAHGEINHPVPIHKCEDPNASGFDCLAGCFTPEKRN
jgi:hypothetical protein